MLYCADDVGDIEVMVIDDTCEVIQTSPIGSLDHMVLFVGPFEGALTADQIVERALTFAGHFHPDHGSSAFGLEGCGLLWSACHELSIVDEGFTFFLGNGFGLCEFFRASVVFVSQPGIEELFCGALIVLKPLRLKVRCIRAADIGAFIPL